MNKGQKKRTWTEAEMERKLKNSDRYLLDSAGSEALVQIISGKRVIEIQPKLIILRDYLLMLVDNPYATLDANLRIRK